MQNNKTNEENIKMFVKLAMETAEILGVTPIDLIYKCAKEVSVEIPKYKPVTYLANFNLKNIKVNNELNFDLNNTKLENGKCYLLEIDILNSKNTLYGFYDEKEKGFIIDDNGFVLNDKRANIKVLGKLMYIVGNL